MSNYVRNFRLDAITHFAVMARIINYISQIEQTQLIIHAVLSMLVQ